MRTLTIGRNATNDLVLNSPYVSREHAKLIVRDDGKILLKDLGSSNGTFVNGKKIAEQILTQKDKVIIADSSIDLSQYFLFEKQEPQNLNDQLSLGVVSNTKHRSNIRWLYLLLIPSVFLIFYVSTKNKSNGINKQATDLIINNKEFSSVITISTPSPDSKKAYDNIINNPVEVDNGFIPRVDIEIDYNKKIEDFDKSLLSFLTKNGYLEIKYAQKQKINRFGTETKTYDFEFYTTKGQGLLVKYANSDYEYGMRVGIRKFKSIDFINDYKQLIDGIESLVYSIKFSYTIEPFLSGFEELSAKSFQGETQLYKDPKDGQWKLLHLELNDNSYWEFLNIIKAKYQPA